MCTCRAQIKGAQNFPAAGVMRPPAEPRAFLFCVDFCNKLDTRAPGPLRAGCWIRGASFFVKKSILQSTLNFRARAQIQRRAKIPGRYATTCRAPGLPICVGLCNKKTAHGRRALQGMGVGFTVPPFLQKITIRITTIYT